MLSQGIYTSYRSQVSAPWRIHDKWKNTLWLCWDCNFLFHEEFKSKALYTFVNFANQLEMLEHFFFMSAKYLAHDPESCWTPTTPTDVTLPWSLSRLTSYWREQQGATLLKIKPTDLMEVFMPQWVSVPRDSLFFTWRLLREMGTALMIKYSDWVLKFSFKG